MWPFSKRSKSVIGHPRDPALASFFGGNATASGAQVNQNTVTRITTVDACIKVLGETMGSMPLMVYRKTDSGNVPDKGHHLWPILHDNPNKIQTSFEWRETSVSHTALRGASYCFIDQNNAGQVTQLIMMDPDRVRPFRAPDNTIAYNFQPQNGPATVLLDREVLRIPALSDDGIIPQSTLTKHRETFGVALSSTEYLARFFSNSAAPKGGITIPATVGPDAAKLLRDSFEERHRGAHNANRIAILDGGMEWTQIGMSNEDAQYLELAQFQVSDLARIFRVPPHKVGDLTRSTFNNIEHQSISFVTDTILPWVTRWEGRLNRSLLTEAGRKTHTIGFEMKGLLRGDSKTRAEFYKKLFDMGVLSANDILRLEDMPTHAGGDTYYVPLNLAPVDLHHEILMRKGPSPTATNGTGEPPGDDEGDGAGETIN